ncbi:MAG: YbbC/YhhH family protein [Bacteroidota bacterium]
MHTYFRKSVFTICLLIAGIGAGVSIKSPGNISNAVPNDSTAIKIAEAIWLPVYGSRVLNKRPFKVELVEGKVWRVEGTLPAGMMGGVPFIVIQKSDCRMLKMGHGK